MAIIYSYPEKSSPAGGDFLVITDSEQPAPNKNRTKSLKLSDLADFVISSKSGITGVGTVNVLAMFTPTGAQIGNSNVSQSGNIVTVSEKLTVGGSATINDNTQTNTLTVLNNADLQGNNILGSGSSNSLTVNSLSSFKAIADFQRVGIFTTTPERELDVNGVIRSFNRSGQAFLAQASSGSGRAIIEFDTNQPQIKLKNSTAIDKVLIKSAGNSYIQGGTLGIGTGGGSAQLEVLTANTFPAAKITNTNTSGVSLVVSRGNSNTGDLQRWEDSSGNIKALVDADGKIGINVTNPARELDVKGSIRTTRPDATNGYAHIALNNEFKAASGIYFENKSAQLLLKKDNAPLNGELNVKISSNTDSYIKTPNMRFGVGATLANARNDSKLYVKDGDIQIDRPDSGSDGGGLVLETPDRTKKYKITISNAGALVITQVFP